MFRHARRQRSFAEINITPFTDVILVLLVIFMVAAPIIYQSNIKIKLPEAKTAEPQPAGEISTAVVTITNEGMVYWNDKLVIQSELREQVGVFLKANKDTTVHLRADQLARFKDVVEVFDLLTDLGVKGLDIAAVRLQ